MSAGSSMPAMLCRDARMPRAQGCAGAADPDRAGAWFADPDVDVARTLEALR
jgi:hypothetical protein